MDELRRHIRNNRELLDTDEPSVAVWDAIDDKLHPVKRIGFSRFAKWAAAACIILLAGFATFFFTRTNAPVVAKKSMPSTQEMAVKPQPQPAVEQPLKEESINPPQQVDRAREQLVSVKPKAIKSRKTEPIATNQPASEDAYLASFAAMEKGYAQMVNMQVERVTNMPIYAEDETFFSLFKKQFADLNSEEKVVKEEIRNYGLSDPAINRLITLYQQKISLLKDLQYQVNKMNNRARNANIDVTKQQPSFIKL